MKIIDSGVLAHSFMDFAVPSTFAKEHLIYLIQYGQFFCDANYHVEREHLDSYLIAYIKSGSLHVEADGTKATALPGQIVLIDCHRPHAYYCTTHTEFIWLHFDGTMVGHYPAFLIKKYNGPVMSCDVPERLWKYIDRIFLYAQSASLNEHMVSLQIMKIFARLAASGSFSTGNSAFLPVIAYIREHYSEAITLEQLMGVCNLSKSHFIREFRKQVGSTPHEYLLSYRLRQSKLMLQSTGDSIEEIGELCGFNSASHFARAFKKEIGMTPTEFRMLRF